MFHRLQQSTLAAKGRPMMTPLHHHHQTQAGLFSSACFTIRAPHEITPNKLGRTAQLMMRSRRPFKMHVASSSTASASYACTAAVVVVGSCLYDILELPPDVGLCDIKKAYRHLARRFHPDVNHTANSTARFLEISEAYETLSDPRRRAAYDVAVARAQGRGSASSQDWQAGVWKLQWECQLLELKLQNSLRARRTESWAARMRLQSAS